MQCKSRAQSLFYAGTRSSSVRELASSQQQRARTREFAAATPRISLMLIFFWCAIYYYIYICVRWRCCKSRAQSHARTGSSVRVRECAALGGGVAAGAGKFFINSSKKIFFLRMRGSRCMVTGGSKHRGCPRSRRP